MALGMFTHADSVRVGAFQVVKLGTWRHDEVPSNCAPVPITPLTLLGQLPEVQPATSVALTMDTAPLAPRLSKSHAATRPTLVGPTSAVASVVGMVSLASAGALPAGS